MPGRPGVEDPTSAAPATRRVGTRHSRTSGIGLFETGAACGGARAASPSRRGVLACRVAGVDHLWRPEGYRRKTISCGRVRGDGPGNSSSSAFERVLGPPTPGRPHKQKRASSREMQRGMGPQAAWLLKMAPKTVGAAKLLRHGH